MVFEMQAKYNYRAFGVESVAYQKAFSQVLKNEMNTRKVNVPSIEIEIDKDKIRRVIEVLPYIEQGKVKFNNSYQDFMAELIQFPKSAHDDFVDAFSGALKIALTYGNAARAITGTGIIYPTSY